MLLFGNGVDNSNPTAPEFCAGQRTNNEAPLTIRGLVKFNFSTVPANATILSAKLSLFLNPTPLNGDHTNANSGPANAFYMGRVTSNWAMPANWFTKPAMDMSSDILVPHTNANFLDVIDLDVKTLVQTMLSTNNYGFKIQLQNEAIYNMRNFCSGRYPNTAKHPKIVVVYQ